MAQLTKEQLAIRDMTREFVQKEVTPFAAEWDRTATVPLDTLRRIGALGLFGVCVPTEWGGGGADFTSYVLATEELAYGDAGLCNMVNATNSFGLKLRDFVSDIYFTLRSRQSYDLYIGVDAVNTLAGLVLRSLGRVERVIFYETDYSPRRYANATLNRLYLTLDGFVARHSDYVWNVTPAIAAARAQVGYPPEKLAPQFVVPVGTFPEQIHEVPYSDLEAGHVVYSGGFSEQNGIWTLLEAAAELCHKLPEARFTILGWGGETLESNMRKFITSNGLSQRVVMPGFLDDHREVEEIISHAWLGIAPFKDVPYSIKRLGDVSKLRMYLSCGIPVVTTDVTYLADEIRRRGAGIVTQDDTRQLVDATIKLLSDRQLHQDCRAAAVAMARHNTWDSIFERAFADVGFITGEQASTETLVNVG